jgi:hypothetical protein
MSGLDANGRVERALRMLTPALQPIVERELRRVYRANWQQNISAAHGTDLSSLDAYALLKTMIDNWQSVFKDGFKAKTRTDVSKAFDGRNAVSHANGVIADADAVSYLTAIRNVAEAIQAKAIATDVGKLIDDQFKAAASAMGVTPAVAAKTLAEPAAPELDLGDRKYQWKAWRDVCPPHPDVMAARFIEAEFAANLADVARGEGPETYRDPREFFRITYMTGGLRQVLQRAIERLSGKGGDPVIGLQTSFGGGKTHTMLALYHLASAKAPETLPGLAELFEAAGVKTLPIKSKPVVFVGSAAGANQPIAIEGARTVKSLWGLIAVKLGGWKAYETIRASDEARTNPGSEALLPILKQAAPCLILLDEVVAYARNLDGLPYDGFVSFFQSLTEAAKAVPGVLVVGSLPESGAEVGNARGRTALLQLEKIFGRIQSAWTPAQGTETYEIIRRRLFQELDDEGLKAREQAVKAFMTFYRNNPGEFPSTVRDRAYEAEMLAAYPVHPELFRELQGAWSGLEKFQKTRGVLKMMAQIVYRLWRDQHTHPMIMPGDMPLTDDKVRTNALDPLVKGYDAVVTKEIAGDQSKPAQIEARSSAVGKSRAVTRAATAAFMATSPFGSTNRGVEVALLRLDPRRAAGAVLRRAAPPGRECGLSLQSGRQLLVLANRLAQPGGGGPGTGPGWLSQGRGGDPRSASGGGTSQRRRLPARARRARRPARHRRRARGGAGDPAAVGVATRPRAGHPGHEACRRHRRAQGTRPAAQPQPARLPGRGSGRPGRHREHSPQEDRLGLDRRRLADAPAAAR